MAKARSKQTFFDGRVVYEHERSRSCIWVNEKVAGEIRRAGDGTGYLLDLTASNIYHCRDGIRRTGGTPTIRLKYKKDAIQVANIIIQAHFQVSNDDD